jgi:hypothetical protein
MLKKTPTGLGGILDQTTGVGPRKLTSWIGSFVEATENLEAPKIFRRWVAISTLAAVMEQKVWVTTSSPVHPNLYILIVGHPGTGKTRTLRVAKKLAMNLTNFHIAPISMTFAAMADVLNESVRTMPDSSTFNSLYICAEEMGAFIHKYDNEMIDGLAAFYDPDPYAQRRRTNDIKFEIFSPQINMVAGVTPQNLLHVLPERAWGQGFMSRVIMVFSDERIIGDDFAPRPNLNLEHLEHDLSTIFNLHGGFHVTEEYRECINNWRALGEPPIPDHPKLTHYVTRRRVHLYKLSMVASVDRGNSLALTRDDFNTALNWLAEAESLMPDIFAAGSGNIDGAAMDEIHHFVLASDRGNGVSEQKIIHFARERVPIHSILRIVEIMQASGQLHCLGVDRNSKIKFYSAKPPAETLN